MKKIYIIRHAKASKSEDIDDFERKLTKSGKEDLKNFLKILLRMKFILIWCYQVLLLEPLKQRKK